MQILQGMGTLWSRGLILIREKGKISGTYTLNSQLNQTEFSGGKWILLGNVLLEIVKGAYLSSFFYRIKVISSFSAQHLKIRKKGFSSSAFSIGTNNWIVKDATGVNKCWNRILRWIFFSGLGFKCLLNESLVRFYNPDAFFPMGFGKNKIKKNAKNLKFKWQK